MEIIFQFINKLTKISISSGNLPLVFLSFVCVYLAFFSLVFSLRATDMDNVVIIQDDQSLHKEISQAKPGTKLLINPGVYQGGLHFRDLKGEPDRPIVISSANPDKPSVIKGGGNCLQFSNISYLEIHNLVLTDAKGNGINIDDGGNLDKPSHHIVLKGLIVRDIGPEGNRDGIKLSGVEDFRVEDCTVQHWGTRGSGIDMVGCHRGIIQGCFFQHGDKTGDNAVQTKGGSQDIVIRKCRFENAGSRAINAGGSTGLQFFRPKPQGYEAKDIIIEGCTFIGSMAPIAFVGVDGAKFRFNTIYRPQRWIIRILQETRGPEFVPSRNGEFIKNIVVFRSDEVSNIVNIGPDTAPETFKFSGNLWYCLDNPSRSYPDLPTPELDGIYGKDPLFIDPEKGDLSLSKESPAHDIGAQALK